MRLSYILSIILVALLPGRIAAASSSADIHCPIQDATIPYVLVIHPSINSITDPTFEVQASPPTEVVASGDALLLTVGDDGAETWSLSVSGDLIGTLYTGLFGTPTSGAKLTWYLSFPSEISSCSQS